MLGTIFDLYLTDYKTAIKLVEASQFFKYESEKLFLMREMEVVIEEQLATGGPIDYSYAVWAIRYSICNDLDCGMEKSNPAREELWNIYQFLVKWSHQHGMITDEVANIDMGL